MRYDWAIFHVSLWLFTSGFLWFSSLFWYILIIYRLFILIMNTAENESEVFAQNRECNTHSLTYIEVKVFFFLFIRPIYRSLEPCGIVYILLSVINNDDSRISARCVSRLYVYTNFLLYAFETLFCVYEMSLTMWCRLCVSVKFILQKLETFIRHKRSGHTTKIQKKNKKQDKQWTKEPKKRIR